MFQPQLVFGLLIGFQFIANKNIYANKTLDLSYADKSLFGIPDEKVHNRLVEDYGPNEINNIYINPEELGSYFEGDMLIISNKTLKSSNYWPNGIVPYDFSPTFSSEQIEIILMAMTRFSSRTCVQFTKRTIEQDYVYIDDKAYGCFSAIGRIGGQQIINLDKPYCLLDIGTIIHELMHTLGFLHEHTRYDRDDSLTIKTENIKPEKQIYFKKRTQKIDPIIDLDYDIASIMQYGPYYSSKDSGSITLEVRNNALESSKMGQRYGLSPRDVKKILNRYCESPEDETKKDHTNIDKIDGIALQFKTKDRMLDLLFNPKYMYHKSN